MESAGETQPREKNSPALDTYPNMKGNSMVRHDSDAPKRRKSQASNNSGSEAVSDTPLTEEEAVEKFGFTDDDIVDWTDLVDELAANDPADEGDEGEDEDDEWVELMAEPINPKETDKLRRRYTDCPNPATHMAELVRMYAHAMKRAGLPVLYWEGLGWYAYNGTRYVQHTDEEFEQVLYRFFVRCYYKKIDLRANDPALIKRDVAFNPDSTFLKKCRESLRSYVLKKDLVHDSWLDGRKDRVVPLRNGLLDLDSGIFTDGHDPQFFNNYVLPFDYNPTARCERFDILLEEIWPTCPGSRKRFLQYLGLILSGRDDLQKMLLMIGRTGSGKSVLAWLMEQLVSPEALAPLDTESLAGRFGIYPLVGKKLGIFHDARDSGRGREMVPVLLRLTGEDSVTAEIKYSKKPWTGRLGIRLVYVSNVPPALPDNTNAVQRRLLALWFEYTVPEKKRDTWLKSKLADELPGIFNRALAEWQSFEADGGTQFAEAPSADHLLAMISAKGSPLLQWVAEECVIGGSKDADSDDYAWTSTAALYDVWKVWADDNGHKPGSSAWFGTELRGAIEYIEPRRKRVGNKQLYGYAGIALVPYEALAVGLGDE